MQRHSFSLATITILVLLPLFMPAASAEERTLVEWRFATEAAAKPWSPGSIANLKVERGVLAGEPTGNDPLLISPVFDPVPVTAGQWVEIRMRSAAGRAELYWTETLEGQHGGFSGRKMTLFDCAGGDAMQTYRVRPFWQAAGKIIRLRIDPPSAGPFAIESIRVVEPAETSKPITAAQWRFRDGAAPWLPSRIDASPDTPPMLESPLLAVPAEEHPIVHVRMAVDRGEKANLAYVTDKSTGWQRVEFPLVADGRLHSYNLDLGRRTDWSGNILLLGLRASDAVEADVALDTIELAAAAAGPADVRLRYFGRTEGVNRTGRPAPIIAVLENHGGTPATGLSATLDAPGLDLDVAAGQSLEPIGYGRPRSVRWTATGEREGRFPIELRVTAADSPGEPFLSATASLHLTPVPKVAESDHIPEPRPVKTRYEVGAYYFPGWHSMSRWHPIRAYPERKPVLGWYDEANPEIADWQIKWAAEHGISFFLVDWYWHKGGRHLEHWLHEAFAKARFRKHMKWCMMWANHNAPGSHGEEDWRAVTQYWIDHYFSDPQYYRINGRPAVFLWSPANIRRDVGGSENAAKLYAISQAMARQAGYEGIYFAAMFDHHNAESASRLADEGFHGTTSYHGFEPLLARLGRRFPFAEVVEYGPTLWRDEIERNAGRMDYFPIVDTGWASEPWHGPGAMTITNRTPELLGKLCREARRFADAHGTNRVILGPWNEWGEGSYIEPYAEYGFDDLAEIRRAFCEPGDYPPNLVPADLGRGPYDLAELELTTAWQFEQAGDRLGWSGTSIDGLTVTGGLLSGRSIGNDPILSAPPVLIDTGQYRRLVVRMKANRDTSVQVFWGTDRSGHGERASIHVPLPGDGELRDLVFDLGANQNWRGVVTSLRVDPVTHADVEFAIESLRFE